MRNKTAAKNYLKLQLLTPMGYADPEHYPALYPGERAGIYIGLWDHAGRLPGGLTGFPSAE
jgi:hypothetical protein